HPSYVTHLFRSRFFLYVDPSPPQISPLSLHDALPISTDLTSVREYLAVTKASVSQMLASLEKRGLLVRQIDPTNRRNLIVTLTSDRKSTRLNSSHVSISYAVFCLKKKTLRPDYTKPYH